LSPCAGPNPSARSLQYVSRSLPRVRVVRATIRAEHLDGHVHPSKSLERARFWYRDVPRDVPQTVVTTQPDPSEGLVPSLPVAKGLHGPEPRAQQGTPSSPPERAIHLPFANGIQREAVAAKPAIADLRSEEWVWVGSRTRLPSITRAQMDMNHARAGTLPTGGDPGELPVHVSLPRALTRATRTGRAGTGRAGPRAGCESALERPRQRWAKA